MGYAVRGFVGLCWIVLMAYWLLAARSAKGTLRPAPRWSGPGARIALVAVVVAIAGLLHAHGRGQPILGERSAALEVLGMLLCATGVALAIWARVHIGRNWGMPMSLREGHELVTSGPYARVRHPIYSGVLLTMLGSALAVDAGWLVAFAVFGAYFYASARTEERDLCAQFPAAYPEYRRCTKRLIPFVL